MTSRMDVRPTRPRLDRSLAARLALPALILVIAVAAHLAAVAWGERREEANVRDRAQEAAQQLETRISRYGDALYGVRGLFAASDTVTHREFRESMDAAAVARRFPGVRAIAFAPLIAAGDVPAEERRLRPLGRGQRARLPAAAPDRPAGQRGGSRRPPTWSRSPGNEEAYGYDLFSEPARTAAADRTLRTGLPMATEPIRLAQETEDQRGFLMMLGTHDPAGRPIGVAIAAFRMGELIDQVFPRETRHADLDLLDAGPVGAPPLPRTEAEVTYLDEGEADRARPRARAARPRSGRLRRHGPPLDPRLRARAHRAGPRTRRCSTGCRSPPACSSR